MKSKARDAQLEANFSRLGRIVFDLKTKLKSDWPIEKILLSEIENQPQYINWIAEKLPKKNLNPSLRKLVSKALTEAMRITTVEEMKARYFLERMKISEPDDNDPEQFGIFQPLVNMEDIQKLLTDEKFLGKEEDLSDFLNTLAIIHNSKGNGTEALGIIKYAVSINEKLTQENFEAYGANLAHSLIILSFLCQQNGKVQKSSQSFSRAIEIHQKTPMRNLYVVLALILASWHGNKNIFNILNESSEGMQLNYDSIYNTMEYACRFGFEEVVAFILCHGGDVNMMNSKGFTPLMWASMGGHLTIAELLLNAGANINATNNEGITTLIAASANDRIDIVKLLLDGRATIDATDKEGRTALWWAYQNDHIEVVKLLLKRNARIDVADNTGHTILSIAEANKNKEIAQLLIEYGTQN